MATIHGTYDVGGHELFMDCTGTGTPTVVMVTASSGRAGSAGIPSPGTPPERR